MCGAGLARAALLRVQPQVQPCRGSNIGLPSARLAHGGLRWGQRGGNSIVARFFRPRAVIGMLAIVAAAIIVLPAASGGDPADDAPIMANFHGKSDNGVYLVRLGDLPAVAYDGGVA